MPQYRYTTHRSEAPEHQTPHLDCQIASASGSMSGTLDEVIRFCRRLCLLPGTWIIQIQTAGKFVKQEEFKV